MHFKIFIVIDAFLLRHKSYISKDSEENNFIKLTEKEFKNFHASNKQISMTIMIRLYRDTAYTDFERNQWIRKLFSSRDWYRR